MQLPKIWLSFLSLCRTLSANIKYQKTNAADKAVRRGDLHKHRQLRLYSVNGKSMHSFDISGAVGGIAPLSVKISFEDSGKPYNPLEKEDPDIELDLDDTPIGGLGIFIVKETMDNVWYERRGGHNIFIMEKELIPVSEREPEKAVS